MTGDTFTPDGWVNEHLIYQTERLAFWTVASAAILIAAILIRHRR